MKPVFLPSARKVENARSYSLLTVPTRVYLLAPCVDSQSLQVRADGWSQYLEFSTRFEDRGGVARARAWALRGRGREAGEKIVVTT